MAPVPSKEEDDGAAALAAAVRAHRRNRFRMYLMIAAQGASVLPCRFSPESSPLMRSRTLLVLLLPRSADSPKVASSTSYHQPLLVNILYRRMQEECPDSRIEHFLFTNIFLLEHDSLFCSESIQEIVFRFELQPLC